MKRVSFSSRNFEHLLQNSALALDPRQIVMCSERMDVEEIDLVHLQRLQAFLHDAPRLRPIAIAELGREKNAVPSPAQRLSDAPLRQVIFAIIVRGIDVSYA
jgi:hypothetical protein